MHFQLARFKVRVRIHLLAAAVADILLAVVVTWYWYKCVLAARCSAVEGGGSALGVGRHAREPRRADCQQGRRPPAARLSAGALNSILDLSLAHAAR